MRYVYLYLLLITSLVGACRPAIDDNAPDPATDAAGVAGGDLTGTYPNPTIKDGAVTPAKLSQAYLPLAGGTMSGALVLSGAPSSSLHASTKSYSDSYLGGQAIDTSALSSITNNQVLGWSSANSKWTPISVVGAADATAIQGTNVDSGAPTTAKVLVYDTAVASKWAPATLAAASLASDSVTTVKILDSNVTAAKLASSSVTNAHIAAAAAIEVTKLAAGTEGQILQNISTTPSWVALDQTSDLQNLTVTGSVAANALTLAMKTKATTDATATDRIGITFRSATATSGSFNKRFIAAALSVTAPSGCTLGHSSAQNGYLYLYAIDNAGTVELAVSGSTLFDEGSLQSTTAIAGCAAASGLTLYSATARANVPIRLIARIQSNQVAAGTWALVPTEIALGAKATTQYAYIQDQEATTVQAGTATAGAYYDRLLTTLVTDEIGISFSGGAGGGCNLGSANVPDGGAGTGNCYFTLPAGKYRIASRLPFYGVNRANCRLRNITDATSVIIGQSNLGADGFATFVSGQFTLSGSKTLSLQCYVQTTVAINGWGAVGMGSNGTDIAVYTEVELWKLPQ